MCEIARSVYEYLFLRKQKVCALKKYYYPLPLLPRISQSARKNLTNEPVVDRVGSEHQCKRGFTLIHGSIYWQQSKNKGEFSDVSSEKKTAYAAIYRIIVHI